VLQLAIRHVAVDARLVGGPDDRGALAVLLDVPVDTVDAGVQPAAEEPAEVHLLEIGVEHGVPGVVPVERPPLLGPEPRRVLERPLVDLAVLLERAQVGALAHVRRDVVAIERHRAGLRVCVPDAVRMSRP